jgi:hypothetical protein
MTWLTLIGQEIDSTNSFHRNKDLELPLTSSSPSIPAVENRFSFLQYKKICQFKTSYYTFFLPLALGLLYGIPSEEMGPLKIVSPLTAVTSTTTTPPVAVDNSSNTTSLPLITTTGSGSMLQTCLFSPLFEDLEG